MKTPIYIIVDVSGSMNEMGKIHLQRNLCRYAAQLRSIDQKKYADLDIRFYEWAQDIFEITIQSDGDIPSLTAKDSSRLDVLSDFLSKNIKGTDKQRVLILSDGNFSREDFQEFLKWQEENKLELIRTVAVGADAELLKLKKISTNNSVHLSENITSAIESTIFGSDEQIAVPISTALIMQSEPAETEEPEEDWDA